MSTPISKHWFKAPRLVFGQYWLRRLIIFLLLPVGLAHALGWWIQPGIQALDAFLYDQRLQLSMPRSLDSRIVIVDVDESSLNELGRWPWSCRKLARLVKELVERQQVKVLGFDAVFGEPEHDPDNPDHHSPEDCPFVEQLKNHPVILGYYFTSDKQGWKAGQLPEPLAGQSGWPDLLHWNGYGANTPAHTQAAAAVGFFNAVTDPDGLVRSTPVLATYENALYESFALAILRKGLHSLGLRLIPSPIPGHPPLAVELLGGSIDSLRIPLDPQGTVRIPYRGSGGPTGQTFPYISAADVLEGRLAPGLLKDRYALIGFSAPGLMDLRTTPVNLTYPGVEIHANFLSGALDGRLIHQPHWSFGYELALLLAVGLLLLIQLPRLNMSRALLLCMGLIAPLLLLSVVMQLRLQLDLPIGSVLTLVLAAALIHFMLGFFVEGRAKHRLAHQFATYVPPQIVQDMLRLPEEYDMTARSQELTVMFCDVQGFTSMSETMSPEALQRMLGDILGRLSQVITEHHGTIDKYIGDCVMAFWGAPITNPNHARHAVDAALAIRQSLRTYNAQRSAQGLPPIAVRMGINTGSMLVGNMGTELRRTYTVIGDAVNLAARLESLAANYNVDLLLTQATVEHAGVGALLWQELDWVRVRGRQGRTTIYTVRGHLHENSPELQHELALWQRALDQWRTGNFDAYLASLEQLRQEARPTAFYQHLMNRFNALQPQSRPNWDAVAEYDKK